MHKKVIKLYLPNLSLKNELLSIYLKNYELLD